MCAYARVPRQEGFEVSKYSGSDEPLGPDSCRDTGAYRLSNPHLHAVRVGQRRENMSTANGDTACRPASSRRLHRAATFTSVLVLASILDALATSSTVHES